MPTVDIPDKICPHCGGTRWYIETKRWKKTSGEIMTKTNYICSLKRREWDRSYTERNREVKKRINKKTYLKRMSTPEGKNLSRLWGKNSRLNKERKHNYYKKYRNKDLEHYNQLSKKNKRKIIDTLSSGYITDLLTKRNLLKANDVPQDLVELKRKQLILTRKIKNNG